MKEKRIYRSDDILDKNLLSQFIGRCFEYKEERYVQPATWYRRITGIKDEQHNLFTIEEFKVDKFHHEAYDFCFTIGAVEDIDFTISWKMIPLKKYNKKFSEFLKHIQNNKKK